MQQDKERAPFATERCRINEVAHTFKKKERKRKEKENPSIPSLAEEMATRAFFVAAVTLSLSIPSLAGIDPDYAENITVYHINPHHYGPNPINMDTGDAAGDMFFDLYIAIINPLVCPDGARSGHHCSNPEAAGPDLVVNELVLEVDRRYSIYARCNIGVNGTGAYFSFAANFICFSQIFSMV